MHVGVGVDAHRDGSGVVRVAVGLDDAALHEVGDLKSKLRVDDLREAGWTIKDPRKERDGLTWVRASKPFTDPADAGRVVAEVSGAKGPFRSFRVKRSRSFLQTTTSFAGTVDLKGGIEGFSDPDLRKTLGGDLPSTALLDRIFKFRVDARLPGSVDANAPTIADGGASWQPKLGERVTLIATAKAWDYKRIAALSISAFALLCLVVGLAARRMTRQSRTRRSVGKPRSVL